MIQVVNPPEVERLPLRLLLVLLVLLPVHREIKKNRCLVSAPTDLFVPYEEIRVIDNPIGLP